MEPVDSACRDSADMQMNLYDSTKKKNYVTLYNVPFMFEMTNKTPVAW